MDANFQPSKKPAIKSMIRIYRDEINDGTARRNLEQKIECLKGDVLNRIERFESGELK